MLNAEMNSEFTSALSIQHSALQVSPSRRGYIDALRGLAVLIMIEAHVLDSWTRFPDRQTRHYAYAMVLGGFGAPLFLFLAGLAVPLSAGSKLRRTGDVQVASRAVARRGLEIFGLAFLFRLQAWALGWSAPWWLLRVDILNIMGPSIMAAAAIWGALNTLAGRLAAFAAATLAIALTTPIVRNISILSPLPDPIEAYLRPAGGLSNFVFFPWAGFVFAGALAGLVLDHIGAARSRTPGAGRESGVCAHRHRHRRGRLRVVVSADVVSAVALLDDLAGVLLPAPRPHDCGARLRVRLGATARRRAEMESPPPTRPDVTLHLLDSRRAGLRPDFTAAAQASVVGTIVAGAGALLRAHAPVLDCQGSSGGAMGSGLTARGSGRNATLDSEPEA